MNNDNSIVLAKNNIVYRKSNTVFLNCHTLSRNNNVAFIDFKIRCTFNNNL